MEHWIVPCNIKYFNIIEHFSKSDTVVWKNSFTIRPGDVVYIYVGAPYGEIKYRCSVVTDTVDEDTLAQNSYAIPTKPSNNYFSKKVKYIIMKNEGRFPDKTLTLEAMRDHGLGQVQIQARTDRRLQAFIDDVERCTTLISDREEG